MFLRGISMKKLLQILRLHYDGQLSQRQIGVATNISKGTVLNYLNLFKNSGLSWPLEVEYQDEVALSKRLNPNYDSNKIPTVLDFAEISKELRQNKKVTLQLLHEEHTKAGKTSYSYTHFALLYRNWLEKQPDYMRQVHKGGEKVFTDYSGDKIAIIDTDTGLLRDAEIFVGALGASNYIYLEATWSQTLPDWTMSHVRMFEHLGGSPRLVIPDNLRSAISKADRYDPDITPAFYHMLAHYGAACMPARVRTPKDKAKAEGSVLITQRQALAPLRNEQIYGLAALNARLGERMAIINGKEMQQYAESRKQLFEQLDKPHLRPLPNHRYVYRDYKKVRVGKDYHIELSGHYYSVPYKLISKEVDVWHSASLVECYHNNVCVAKHIRSTDTLRGKTTESIHMPIAHREYASLTPDKMKKWAEQIGTATSAMVEQILKDAPHDEIGCKKSHGFLNLSKKYSEQQLESACYEAFTQNIKHYKSIEVIIKRQLTSIIKDDSIISVIPLHENIRGPEYYQ